MILAVGRVALGGVGKPRASGDDPQAERIVRLLTE